MRLLTPAVLLVLFWNLATGSAADSRTSFSERQSPVILPTNNTNATALPASIPGQRAHENNPVATTAPESATITIPTGTKITLALTSPIWARTTKGGDPVYATTAFPVVSSKTMVIPAGTYVLGQIDSVTKPGWRTPRAEFLMHFSKIIFAGGYTLELESAPVGNSHTSALGLFGGIFVFQKESQGRKEPELNCQSAITE